MTPRSSDARRTGNTLVELVVALAILAVVVPVSLRLFFLTDRAIEPQSAKAASTGGQAQLLEDMGRDIRQARSAAGQAELAIVSGDGTITYGWSEERQATLRHVGDRPGETREYPGIHAEFGTGGRVVQVYVRGDGATLRTAYLMRN